MSRATLAGATAILLWSALAALTAASGLVPPFELMALSFSVAFAAATVRAAWLGRPAWRRLRQPIGAWTLCLGSLFFYHALYFFALQAAPPAEASLIGYLWPLLIVLFSGFAPGGTLRAPQLGGAALGLAGTALLVLDRAPGAAGTAPVWGDLAALGCALVWSSYSVANRRYAGVPADIVAMACGPVAMAALVCHLAVEHWVMPSPGGQAAILALGLGPVGLAFVAWDYATKHGSLPLLGALSYLAPLASTLILVAVGTTAPRVSLIAAAALILAGAALAASAGGSTAIPDRRTGPADGRPAAPAPD